jgi:hypothetical protein
MVSLVTFDFVKIGSVMVEEEERRGTTYIVKWSWRRGIDWRGSDFGLNAQVV